MYDLSTSAIIEKNKLSSDHPWLILLEIQLSSELIIKVVRNNEDITWNNAQWIAFPFDIEELTEDSKGELPQFSVKVSNISRTIQRYIEEANGGVSSIVILRVVHSSLLEFPDPEIEEVFSVQGVRSDPLWVTFTLGGDYPTMRRIPSDRYLKDWCHYKYKSIECASLSDLPLCFKTLADCRARKNSIRFGGEPGLGGGGLYASNL